jgi:hypothetical protein
MKPLFTVLELFCGTKSFSKEAEKFGALCATIDNNPLFKPTFLMDLKDFDYYNDCQYNVIWASPPCQCFSTGSFGKHWTGGRRAYKPADKSTRTALKLLDKTISIIAKTKPNFYFIENPRAMMRKVIEPIFEKYGIRDYEIKTVWYCAYGDKSAKPTDIFTNLESWNPRPLCRNGNPLCHHERAPRGAKTGTQGKNGSMERAVIPAALCNEIAFNVREAIFRGNHGKK